MVDYAAVDRWCRCRNAYVALRRQAVKGIVVADSEARAERLNDLKRGIR